MTSDWWKHLESAIEASWSADWDRLCRELQASVETLSDGSFGLDGEEESPVDLIACELVNSARLLAQIGDNRADHLCSLALELTNHVPLSQIQQASFQSKLANYYMDSNQLTLALKSAQFSVAEHGALNLYSTDYAIALDDLGLIEQRLGQFKAAAQHHESAYSIFAFDTERPDNFARSLHNLASVYSDLGDLETAILLLGQALSLKRQINLDQLDIALTISRIGNSRGDLGEYETALQLHFEAMTILESEAPNSQYIAREYNNIGANYLRLKQLGFAMAWLEKSLLLKRSFSPDSLEVADTLNNLGCCKEMMGDVDEAIAFHSEALQIRMRIVPGSYVVAYSLSNLGSCFIAKGQGSNAISALNDALEIQNTNEHHTHWISTAWSLANVLWNCGEAKQSREMYRQIWQRIVGGFDKIVDSVSSRAYATRFFELASDLCVTEARISNGKAVWEIIEASRARALIRSMTERTAGDEELDALRRRFDANYARYVGREFKGSVQSQIKVLNLEFMRYQHLHEMREFGVSTFATNQNFELERVELLEGTLAIAYMVCRRVTVVAWLDHQGAFGVELIEFGSEDHADNPNEFGWRTRINNFSVFNQPQMTSQEWERQGREWFNQVFPVCIRNKVLESSTLVIFPDQELWQLPFHSLVSPKNEYLGTTKQIVLAHSLGSYCSLEKSARTTQGSVIIVGKSNFELMVDGSPETSNLSKDPYLKVGNLVHAVEEAQVIAGLYNVIPLLEVNATTKTVLDKISSAKCVHLASHSFVDDTEPMLSGVLLSGEDGPLRAYHILESRMIANIVVLSACNTGCGSQYPGEGLVGLTYSFLRSGCRSVVASLWTVDDEATKEFMFILHSKLQDQSVANAMQCAMKSMHEKGYTPYYWSAFCLYGSLGSL